MGHLKNILFCSLLLAVLAPNKFIFVKGQGLPLQKQPDLELSQLRKSGRESGSPIITEHQAASISEKAGVHDDQTLAWRLPREVLPSEYYVKIAPVIDEGQDSVIGKQWFVPGDVNITVRAQRLTRNIVMHSKNITIHDIKVSQGSSEVTVTNFTVGRYDFLNITLEADLQPGQTYTVSINFTSYITEDLNGLYRSSYINPDTNETVWLATTQMEALHARQMIPCFDEPALKSVFHFTIGHMEKYLALFNTESTGKTAGPVGWVWESFAPTVIMSPYLLALIVSNFTYSEAPVGILPGKTVRTYAPDHYIREGAGIYAAEHAARILKFFGEYFNQEYPLSKMDSAAVPDFYFGAMENYGLNIYRETALLVFPGVTPESQRWGITSVIVHELAHQWFGNLVSPAFWTHIWLNEGFATYFASVGSAHTYPEFEPRKRFLNDAVQRSMELAADPRFSHSVKIGETEWATRDEINWFDYAAYEQGASLIRMMDGFLSTEVLTGGLKIYLERMKYKAAQQDDLFDALTLAGQIASKLPAGLTMKDIMDTWTLKAGFPLVRVSRASSNRIYVSQEKFTNDVGARSAGNFVENELWHIPISIATKSSPNFNPAPNFWLDKNVAMTTKEINADEWVILNAGSTGYYRVLYDVPLTNLIKAQLAENHNVVDPLTRSQLQDDYFTAAYQKYINIVSALDLTTYLAKEEEIIVWNTVLKHFMKPLNLFGASGSSTYSNLRNYLLPKIKAAVHATGGLEAEFDERAGMPILRHQQFLDWACALEDEDCRNFALNRVNEWKQSNNNTIPLENRQTIYCSAVAKGNDDIFQFVKEQYNATKHDLTRYTILNGLGCATDVASIYELLQGIITDKYYVLEWDASEMLYILAKTTVGRAAVLRFVRENAPAIRTRFGSADPIAAVFSTAGSYVSTPAELITLESVASEISDTIADVKSKVDAALTSIRGNIAWINYYEESFSSFFASQKEHFP